MFDFAWSELGVIAVVALIFIGPKDMPVALKSVTGMIKKARRMAAEFQTHVDDMVRDADLHEVRDQISALRGYTVKGALEKFVDEDGSIRRSFDDPLAPVVTPAPEPTPAPDATPAEATLTGDVAVAERMEIGSGITVEPEPEPPPRPATPAFIPPSLAPLPEPPALALAPAFIPPEFARAGRPGPGA